MAFHEALEFAMAPGEVEPGARRLPVDKAQASWPCKQLLPCGKDVKPTAVPLILTFSPDGGEGIQSRRRV
jgi:hypothetical protein